MAVSPWAQVQDQTALPPQNVLAPVQLPDSGLDLHAGLAKVFPPAPQISLDQNPAHQIQGAFDSGNAPEAMRLHEQGKLAKDFEKDADPYGSPDNHPGFLGKLAHALSHATGGDTRRGWEEQGLAKQINSSLADESTNAYRNAETGKATEETKEMPGKTASEEGLQGAETAEAQAKVANGPDLATAYAHAVNQAIKNGVDPSQDPIVQHLSDAITSIQKQAAPPPGTKTVQLEMGGKPHQVLVDERTGQTIRDLGESGEKPPTVNVNEGHKEELAQKQQVYKTYQPVMDSAERFNVMGKNYEDAIKNHDQQAMLSLLYNHMGMTMGLQKGARMTKDLIHEAQQSQPWLQGIAAKFDKDGYLTGVTLSPRQMQEMVNNAQGRYQEDVVKARNEGKYLGAQDDGPERTPNASVINFYTAKANGDPAKAKQLAAQDGWSVH